MKKTITRILSVLIVLMTVAGMVYGFSNIAMNTSKKYENKIDSFHSQPENSVEVMIYGSSKMLNAVVPAVLYENNGIGAYNYSLDWQSLSTESLFFYESLETQSPKVIIIDTSNISDLLYDVGINGEVSYSRYLMDNSEKKEYLKNAFGAEKENYISYYFPFSQMHSAWSSLQKENFIPEKWLTKEFYDSTMGYCFLENDLDAEPYDINIPNPYESTQVNFRPIVRKKLNQIVDTCKKKNIEIVFVTVPYEGENHFRDALTEYAEENDCAYLDYFCLQTELNPQTDFRDSSHLNYRGAVKLSSSLGEYLSENYELTDMRKVDNNPWEGTMDYLKQYFDDYEE